MYRLFAFMSRWLPIESIPDTRRLVPHKTIKNVNFSFVPKNHKVAKNTKVKIAETIKKHAFKRFCIFEKVGNIHTKVHAKYEIGSF